MTTEKEEKAHLGLFVEKPLIERVKALAQAEGRSISNQGAILIREALDARNA